MQKLVLYLWGKPAVRTKPLTKEQQDRRIAKWARVFGESSKPCHRKDGSMFHKHVPIQIAFEEVS